MVGEMRLKVVSPIVVATRNQGKLVEYQRMFLQLGMSLASLEEAKIGFELELQEDADTFEENAHRKAQVLHGLTGSWALGDDSGLEVDALGGDPGVLSARYAGINTQGPERDRANNQKLLHALEGVVSEAHRTARFVCAIVLVGPNRQTISARGTCEGRIAFSPSGSGGFGYDPVFLPDGYACSMAELSLDNKNQISHRGKALRELLEKLRPHR